MEDYKLFLFNHYEYNAPLNIAYNKHCHIGYEVIFFIRGDADFVCEDHRFPCYEFDILIVPPLGFHFTKHNVDPKNERFVMEFKHLDEVDAILKKLFATFAIINVKDNPIIIDWFYRFEKYRTTIASVYEAAKRGYVDDIIEINTTRQLLISGFDMLADKE